jgi:hypothetical protein
MVSIHTTRYQQGRWKNHLCLLTPYRRHRTQIEDQLPPMGRERNLFQKTRQLIPRVFEKFRWILCRSTQRTTSKGNHSQHATRQQQSRNILCQIRDGTDGSRIQQYIPRGLYGKPPLQSTELQNCRKDLFYPPTTNILQQLETPRNPDWSEYAYVQRHYVIQLSIRINNPKQESTTPIPQPWFVKTSTMSNNIWRSRTTNGSRQKMLQVQKKRTLCKGMPKWRTDQRSDRWRCPRSLKHIQVFQLRWRRPHGTKLQKTQKRTTMTHWHQTREWRLERVTRQDEGHYGYLNSTSWRFKRRRALRWNRALKAQRTKQIKNLDRSPRSVFIPTLGKSYQFLQRFKAPIRKVSKQPELIQRRYTREVWELEIKVRIRTLDSKEEFLIKALIDSGCTHSTINSDFV